MTRRRPIDRHSAWLYPQPKGRTWWTGRRARRRKRARALVGRLDLQYMLSNGIPAAESTLLCHAAEDLVRDALAWYRLAAHRVRAVADPSPARPLTSPRHIAAEIASAGGADRYLSSARDRASAALHSLGAAVRAEQAAHRRWW